MLKLNDPNFSVLRLKNRHWLPAIQRIRFYFPACHLLVWEPYFSLLNCLSSVCLGRSYYLFNLKSLLALFPKARTPFICFSIFHDILKIWLLRTSSSHDLWSEYEFPMKILTTRCFKIVSSLTSATCLALLEYCCAMTSAQTASLETFLGSWGAVTPHCAFWSRTTQFYSNEQKVKTQISRLLVLMTHCQVQTNMDMKRQTQMALIGPLTESPKVLGRCRAVQRLFGALRICWTERASVKGKVFKA